ncbi:hypothetical protein EVAR_62554_1 [Eumeta japonica]|uniref:Uncharacterized protein n=1 Tax=Eumeta variegata TaxID=151549 RepID=A0A4C1YXH8_EUMVA|nr:hypothetical protein EVAR_62554_1 [Eumeta japonica]
MSAGGRKCNIVGIDARLAVKLMSFDAGLAKLWPRVKSKVLAPSPYFVLMSHFFGYRITQQHVSPADTINIDTQLTCHTRSLSFRGADWGERKLTHTFTHCGLSKLKTDTLSARVVYTTVDYLAEI